MCRMLYPLGIWSAFILLHVLKNTCTDAVIGRESRNNLHQHMTKREIEYYFGVKDPSEIPEYEVRAPHQTEANGRAVSHYRRRRSIGHPDVLHYKLHAFGSKLQLRLKRNLNLMSPNLVIERHHIGGMVTTHPAPRNNYFLGKVSSDPDSLVALRSHRGLSGMIRTSRDLFFVQPLPAHLAKRVRRSADSPPHLIYRLPLGNPDAASCQTKTSGNDRLKRSVNERTTRDTNTASYKYLEAALIVPKSYEEKYGSDHFHNVLLVTANMVAGMYQDPSIGEIKVYYVVTKIIVLNSTVQALVGFSASASNNEKLTKILRWTRPAVLSPDNNTDHYDVFSYVSNKIPVGGLATFNSMCSKFGSNGNIQADLGLQTALHIAHEIGHNFKLEHDSYYTGCDSNSYIMAASLPGGIYAARWSNCSRNILQAFLKNDAQSWCLNDPPTVDPLSHEHQGKLPGEIFNGDDQCAMQYGTGWILSPYQRGNCGTLYCFKGGTQLSYSAPVADGSPCGTRSWCIGGQCVDNGRPRINGGWSTWASIYSSCTRNCGGGVQYRKRVCSRPVPSNGGSSCEGPDKEWKICNPEACPEGSKTFRQEQCSQNSMPAPYYRSSSPCALWCRSGSYATSYGTVTDGTRCTSNESPNNLDVCIQGSCQPVGCDHVLKSNKMIDRCEKCGGDGDTCFVVSSNYTTSHNVAGIQNADLMVRLAVGAYSVSFEMRKSSNNYIGVQSDNGTHLVGGGRSLKVQTVIAANTTILYTRKKGKYRDVLQIPGPTNAFLRVVYVYVRGANPGVDYDFIRPVKPEETPPEKTFEWVLTDWTGCSASCGKGFITRSARCIRSDDKTPASNRACGTEPSTKEECKIKDCPSAWYVTPWSDCSRSCGRGIQTRNVTCRMKIDENNYETTSNCSNDTKPSIGSTMKYCNRISCDSDWNTEDADFVRGQCGEPFKPGELKCYHLNQFGDKARIPDVVCRYREKPVRLPCTTLPPPTTTTRPPESKTDSTKKPTKKSQSIQAQSSMVAAILIPVLQIVLDYFIFT